MKSAMSPRLMTTRCTRICAVSRLPKKPRNWAGSYMGLHAGKGTAASDVGTDVAEEEGHPYGGRSPRCKPHWPHWAGFSASVPDPDAEQQRAFVARNPVSRCAACLRIGSSRRSRNPFRERPARFISDRDLVDSIGHERPRAHRNRRPPPTATLAGKDRTLGHATNRERAQARHARARGAGLTGSEVGAAVEQVLSAIAATIADSRGRWLFDPGHADAVANMR
jgi:hypothetical protein